MLDHYFGLSTRGTTVGREARAGLTTFMVMAYIIFVREIRFDDLEDGFPALLTLTVMPFTYSITNGIGAGFIAYCFIKLGRGKGGEVHPMMYVASVAFVVYFTFAR